MTSSFWENLMRNMQSLVSATGSWKNHGSINKHLGIELCSENMLAKLPPDKLSSYDDKLTALMGKRKTTLQDMQSVVGCLQFATTVILPVTAFARHLVNTTLGVKKPFQFVTLHEEASADIRMWFIFCHSGKTMFFPLWEKAPPHWIYTQVHVRRHVQPPFSPVGLW